MPKISELSSATALDSDDLIPAVEDGYTVKATTTQVATVIGGISQTLTNKTINATDNTITDASAAAGDILKHNGTKFVRLARGSANYVLKVNAGGTDIEWGAAGSGTPAGSTGEIQYNNAGSFGGATNVLTGSGFISIGANPSSTGAFRLANTGAVYSRNAANDGDVKILALDSSNRIVVGGSATQVRFSTDTNDKSYTILLHDSVQTTNATQTTCGTITIPTDSCCSVVATFRAIQSDGSTSADFTRRARAKNDGGVLTIGSVFDIWSDKEAGFATTDTTLDVSGTTVRGRVTGVAATTIRWSVTFSVEFGVY